jgi:transposase-like protein
VAGVATVGETIGYRHGRRERQLRGSFGPVTISVPRARLTNADGTNQEWRSQVLPRYARMAKQLEALIAGAYLSGTNTRRVRDALKALFKGAVSKDTVSRVSRNVQTDWEAWCHRSLVNENVVRLILDGTVVRRRRSRCWWSWASGATARNCCWRSTKWAGRARWLAVACSTIWYRAG